MMAQTRVFISYSHADSAFVDQLADRLKACGIDVWIDKWKIKVGDSITHKIDEGIGTSDFLIIVLSRASISSRWVQEELNAATVRNVEQEKGAFILPIFLEDCTLPSLLRHRKYANFKDDPEGAFRELLEALQSATVGQDSAPLELAKQNQTAEGMAQLGVAIGSNMPASSTVVVNHFPGRATQMVKQAIISGIASAGMNVIEDSTVPLPVLCYYVRHVRAAGGVHIRPFPIHSERVDVGLLGEGGMPLGRSVERQIAQLLFSRHFRQVPAEPLGNDRTGL